MKSQQTVSGWAILFCGVPGTLKTFLASRISGRLGFGYLPTSVAGGVPTGLDPRQLDRSRHERYLQVAEAARTLVDLGATIVVDGGFTTAIARQTITHRVRAEQVIVVHCVCSDEALRHRRLLFRSRDPIDHEAASANEITQGRFEASAIEEDPRADLVVGAFRALLRVDTVEMSADWLGPAPRRFRNSLLRAVTEVLAEYRECSQAAYTSELQEHFNELAIRYDNSTDWRAHPQLLDALHRELTVHPARVLDMCSGTGLASEWYRAQGHSVVGLDLSPTMLRHAAKRLSLTVLASATEAPFLDDYFDLILIRQCLHYVDAVALLRKARRILRRDGWLVVAGAIAPDEDSRQLLREFKAVTQPLRLQIFTAERFRRLLEGAGFLVEREELLEIPREESFESLRRRAPEPAGGWRAFLNHVVQLGEVLAPKVDFRIEDNNLTYRQHWITLWARHSPQKIQRII